MKPFAARLVIPLLTLAFPAAANADLAAQAQMIGGAFDNYSHHNTIVTCNTVELIVDVEMD